MEIRKFRRHYDLELIPAAHADLTPGTLVWDPLLSKPRFAHKGMPNHLLNAFYDAALITMPEWEALMADLKAEPLVTAGLAEQSVKLDLEAGLEMEEPRLGRLEAHLDLSQVREFRFGQLELRRLSNPMRMELDDYLEVLRRERWAEYDGSIRRVFMITELYYGGLEITIDKSQEAQVKAALEAGELSGELATKSQRKRSYVFSHQEVPFAMRLERVKHFNG